MEIKHMKRCSILFVIRELQVKAKMRSQYKPIRMAKLKTNSINCWQGYRATGTVILVRMQKGTATLDNSLTYCYRAKHSLIIQSNNRRPRDLGD